MSTTSDTEAPVRKGRKKTKGDKIPRINVALKANQLAAFRDLCRRHDRSQARMSKYIILKFMRDYPPNAPLAPLEDEEQLTLMLSE